MAAPYPQIVLFGDSLFEMSSSTIDGFCLAAALQQHSIRRFDVVNRGFSGYNTSQALKALPQIFPAPPHAPAKLAYVVVLLGANDAAVPSATDNQHVDLAQYEANLTRIVTHPNITAHQPRKIFLVTPPPLDGIRIRDIELQAGKPHASREAPISASYSEAARRVAKAVPGIELIDLWQALMDVAVAKTEPPFNPQTDGLLGDVAVGRNGYLPQLLPDGLHLSGEAYKVFFELLRPHIAPTDEERASTATYVFPEWRTAPWLDE